MSKVVVLLMVLSSWGMPMAASQGDARWRRVRVSDPFGRRVLEEALEGAAARLTRRDCRSLFDSYRDANGRPLSDRLAALGTTPAGYLRLVVFRDGGAGETCQGSNTPTPPSAAVSSSCACRGSRADGSGIPPTRKHP
jgi:hypothetical protein